MLRRETWLIVVAVVCASCGAAPEHADGDPKTEGLVRRYLSDNPEFLLDNPEILEKVRQAGRERQERRATTARRALLEARARVVVDPELTPVTGAVDGSVTIVEFSDYQCVPCKASYPVLAAAAASDPELRFVHKQLPVYGSHSVLAARAATAAHRQGRFEMFHDALMTNTAPLSAERLYELAGAVGLDVDRLREDMRDSQLIAYLAAVKDLAEELGIDATPTFIVGDRLLRGGLSDDLLRASVAEARASS
ncbi:MAG TPA: thioredoxin domain-containing protein [Acidobacteriota bacterium]|nr:thioredoxin domain-containing protein [Acidobacteriota bacterium]